MAQLIEVGASAVATPDGELAGAVRVHPVSADTGEFGMLPTALEHRGNGVGRALVDFAKQHSRDTGLRAM